MRTSPFFTRNLLQAVAVTPVCLMTLLIGCSKTHDPAPVIIDPVAFREIPAAQQENVAAVVQGNTAFACDLYQQLRTQDGNLFLSPYSVSTGLAMAWAGAEGQTAAEMAQVLHIGLSQGALHPAFGALQQSLDTGTSFGGYELDIANQLWGQQGFAWSSDFLQVLQTDYAAPLQQLNFASGPELARVQINDWVAGKTSGKITELMPAGTITSKTVFALTDAIYFKGRWNARFDKANTRNGSFQLASGAAVTVPFMAMNATLPSNLVDGVQILEMPYQGKDLSMIILLPVAKDGLPALEAKLTPANLAAWTSKLTPVDDWLQVPKFSFTSAFSLSDTLKAMGMPAAFDPISADFSGMDGARDISIQAVQHKAYVAVDEEGTVAAAATGIAGVTSAPPPFSVNHPFLFLILDKVTGSVLFLGRVNDPSLS